MPDNPTPAAQPEPDAEPAEFNFDKPTENPRIKRRSLKTKSAGPAKPAGDLERETPARSVAASPPAQSQASAPAKPTPVVVRASETTAAPPRTTPSSTGAASHLISGTAAKPASSSTTSPHGTRPATLYYSSSPRKDKEAPSPMKPTSPASAAPSASHSAPANSASNPTSHAASSHSAAPRSSATPTSRPSAPIDYRANVERQSREQRSVGNILAYVVYGFIFVFFVCAGLTVYGAKTIFDRLHDQSQTVSDLDAHYSEANKELNAKLMVAQDTLSQAQAEIARQQDVIVKQQEELNHMIATETDTINALKTEKAARNSDVASLRARVRDLENRETEIR